jgi:hypothetical protein
MTTARRSHPRAGLAIGALLLAVWLAALGVAIADDGSTNAESRAAPNASGTDAPVARLGRAGPGYFQNLDE